MKRATTSLLLLFAFPSLLQAQAPNPEAVQAMKKLNFLIGQWRGEGWTETGPGKRLLVRAMETVQSKVGGELLFIEGLGTSRSAPDQPETKGHDALGFLYYDVKAKMYRFQGHRGGGLAIDSEAKVTDGSFAWQFTDDRSGATIRFTMRLSDKGEWFEIGEASVDGQTWRKFFEMTLQKTN